MRKFRVSVNGNTYEVDVEELNGGSFESTAAPVEISRPVEVSKPVVAPAPKQEVKPVAPQGGVEVKSPMPGVVNRVVANSGSVVKTVDPVIVLEAMKMENDIAAPADGTVTILVKQGDSIETGTIIAVIK